MLTEANEAMVSLVHPQCSNLIVLGYRRARHNNKELAFRYWDLI